MKSRDDLSARMMGQHARQVRDRHFCISEPIYGPFFNRPHLITGPIIDDWLRHNPLVVFCFAPNDWMPPQEGAWDTPEHVAGITANRQGILDAYRELATRGDRPYKAAIYNWANYEDVLSLILLHEGRTRR